MRPSYINVLLEMKRPLILLVVLLAMLVCHAQNVHFLKSDSTPALDYSGKWYLYPSDSLDQNSVESFQLNIYKENNAYKGSFCMRFLDNKHSECSESENVTITEENNKLHLLLLSETGGMVKGYLNPVSSHQVNWISEFKMGESQIPKLLILVRDEAQPKANPYALPIKYGEEPDVRLFTLADTILKSHWTGDQDKVYLAELPLLLSRVYVYLISDCTMDENCHWNLVSFNSEGKEMDVLDLMPRVIAVNEENNLKSEIISYEIFENNTIEFLVRHSKNDKEISTEFILYSISPRGEFVLSKTKKKEDSFTYALP